MTKIPIKKYVLNLIIFSLIVVALTLGMQFFFPEYASPSLPFIVIFFFFITLITLYIIYRNNPSEDKQRVISRYLLSRTVKFLSCLIFLLLYMVFNSEDKWRFAIAFIIIYFLYSLFEVLVIKSESKKPEEK